MSWLANSLQTQETLPKRMWVLGTEIFTRDLVPRFSRRNSEDFPFNSPPLSHSFHAPDVASEDDLNSSREHRLYSLPLRKDHSHSLEEKMVPLQPCLTSPSSGYRLGIFSSIQGTPLDPSLATNTQPRSNFQISLAVAPTVLLPERHRTFRKEQCLMNPEKPFGQKGNLPKFCSLLCNLL